MGRAEKFRDGAREGICGSASREDRRRRGRKTGDQGTSGRKRKVMLSAGSISEGGDSTREKARFLSGRGKNSSP